MLRKQRTYRKTVLIGMLVLLCSTLFFGFLLIFTSAYFREKENHEISDAILNKCIQETDSTLSSIDQNVTEFLLDNNRIGQYMVMSNIEKIEEYKMKQALNRFNSTLNYYYGDDVSLYLLAPRANRIYLNGALYKYDAFGYGDWVEEIASLTENEDWTSYDGFQTYQGFETFTITNGFIKSYEYPVGAHYAYGSANVIVPEYKLIRSIASSLPTEDSQIYVLDGDEILYAAGKDYMHYADHMLKRKDRSRLFKWPATPSYYSQVSAYTGWQYVLRIPKTGAVSLWSPIGTIYAILILIYCFAVSIYLASLFGRPYAVIQQMLQQMRGNMARNPQIETDEFLEIQMRFMDLNRGMNDLQNQLETYRFDVCDKLILDLITSDRITSYEEHEQKMRKAGLSFYKENYCAILVCRDDDTPVLSNDVLEKITPLRDEKASFLCTQANVRSVLLLLTGSVPLEKAVIDYYLTRLLKSFEEDNVILGVGTVCAEPQDMVSSYENAEVSIQYGIKHKLHGIVDYQTILEEKRQNELGERITRFIEENYCNPEFSLNLLEESFSMTASHLARVFKEYSGETIQNRLTELRVERAERLMEENPREPLESIAEKVGYVNVQALNRAFKKERGMSPRKSTKIQP